MPQSRRRRRQFLFYFFDDIANNRQWSRCVYPRNVFVTYVRTTINLKNLIGIYAAGISIGTYNIKIFLYNMSVECIVFIIIYIGTYLTCRRLST